MRTTLTGDDKLVARAAILTDVEEKPVLFPEGLIALIERESARRLVALGSPEPSLQLAARLRTDLAE